jgi:cell wall-associated NlpC family hydrolase
MASRAGLSGIALAEIGLGVILAWSGIENEPIASTLRSLAGGQKPASGPPTSTGGYGTVPLSAPNLTGSGAVTSAASDSAIATDALRYQGAGYVWAGAPLEGVGNWDCSSFANWVCGKDLGLAIPGYAPSSYSGATHGPATTAWLVWGGLETVGHDGASSQAGDLCIWQTHMGIAIGGGRMISAQDPELGTGISGIDGAIPGELLFVRRYLESTISVAPSG